MIFNLVFLAISSAGVFGEKLYPGSENQVNCVSTVDIKQDKNVTGQKSLRNCEYVFSTEYNFCGGGIGRPAKFKEYPHMAAIGWTQASGKVEYDCGGSLISEDFVLTAGHCTSRDSVQPDIVRLGDLNLFSAEDDEFSQLINIAMIIRHPEYRFSSKYYDIALLKLERLAKVTFAVIPACLFRDENAQYEELVAAGWGNTGYGEKKSDKLLKFQLAPMSNQNCSEYYPSSRFLKQGLVDHQLCAVDNVMDTCEGDSGGPLVIKVNLKNELVPYIVGITSFGLACGLGSPGVYTKAASFAPWIESIVGISYDQYTCGTRHFKLRESSKYFVSQGTHGKSSKAVTKIGSRVSNENIEWFCVGALISESYVVTSASCVNSKMQPNIVEVGSEDLIQRLGIKRTLSHPQYNPIALLNNLGLIQLEHDVRLSAEVFPSCVWPLKDNIDFLNVQTSGVGPVNYFTSTDENAVKDLDISITIFREKCEDVEKRETEVCLVKKKQSILPRTCEIKKGTPLRNILLNKNEGKVYNYIMGVYSYGENCGYGTPLTYTNIASYIDWMDSVMLFDSKASQLKKSNYDDRIVFFDDDKK